MFRSHVTAPEIKPLEPGRLEVITTHVAADFDAVASMIAAGRMYPDAVMVFPGSAERNIHNFYIQSVIYLFNVARLKEVDFDQVGRLILVDTRHRDRIGSLARLLDRPEVEVHIYDHHPPSPSDVRGSTEIIETVGANATLMTELLAAQEIEITPEEATVLATGIYEDTGSFTFASTSPRDYMAAAHLLTMGADLHVVSEMLTREMTVDQVELLNELLGAVQHHTINGVDLAVSQAAVDDYVDELAVLVNKIMDMKSLSALFALVRMDERIYLVARSRTNQVNVGEIARQFGGGGHPAAAAASIKDLTLPQAEVALLRCLSATLTPAMTARDMMAFPVIALEPDDPLEAARELMIRYDVNALVVQDDRRIHGYVSRQNVDKALHHELTVSHHIQDIMTTEFGLVSPEADFEQVQELIVEQKQRIVPVVENGRAIGVITRTDLLNILTDETENGESQDPFDVRGRTKKITHTMRERLPREVFQLLADVGRTAQDMNMGAFAVGGFVRDLLLHQVNLDIDVVIEGDAVEFAGRFVAEHQDVRMRAHEKFNTAVLIFESGLKIDVTTARIEYYEHPGALPVVEQGSIRLDLYRRDFTINTLAVALNPRNFGMVIDYFRGLKDLKEGYIRVLHNLSFVEDPTRVFRAVRFEQRFGFKIGKLTAGLIQNAVKHDFFRKLSGKRLGQEIRLILREEDPYPAVARMAELDLLKFIHPNLKNRQGLNELFRRINKVRDWFRLTYIDENMEPVTLYLWAMVEEMSPPEIEAVCQRLRLFKRERYILLTEKNWAEKALWRMSRQDELRPSEVYGMLSILDTESILYIMAKTNREKVRKAVSHYFTVLRHVKPEVTGTDLIEMGYQPGPRFSRILDRLRDARLDGEAKNRADELEMLQRLFPLDAEPED